MPEAAGEAGGHREELNLTPPAEGFELYRHKDANETKPGLAGAVLGQAQRGWRLRDPGRNRGGRSVLRAGRRLP
jgi:hypothetical protein